MSIKDVEVIITRETAALTQAGFGLPLILGTSASVDYTLCTDTAAVKEAGFAEETAVYKMAQAVFAQSPSPPQVAVVGYEVDTDPETITAALNDLIETRNDWYFLLCEEQSGEAIAELSAWAQANKKLYLACPDDTVANVVTLAGELAADRTALIYHDEPTSYPDAAWVGRCAPELPGGITWKFKTLQGITPADVTTTEIGDLHDAKVNTYVQKYGINQTSEGKTTDGEYIDVIRGQDWVEARLAEGISRLLITSPKVPYDVRGISLVLAEVEAVMQQAVANGIIAVDEDGNGLFVVTAPDIADISANDKANRHLPDVKFEFTLAGAIHSTTVRGVIRV